MKTLTCTVEDKILHVLQSTGPCSLDEVSQQLRQHDWSEVLADVDRMSRDGRIVLRRDPGSSGYRLSLPLSPVRFCVGCGYLCDEIRPEDGQGQWMDAHRYLDKYRLHWSDLDRTDDACPHCARVLACAHHRAPAETARAANAAT